MQIANRTCRLEVISRIFRQNNIGKFRCRLFSLILVFAILVSCSDDSLEVSLTFLEKNHDTEWLLSNPDVTVYIKIHNNEAQLIEQWRYDAKMDCYDYNSNIFQPGDYQILENTEYQLVVSCDAILGDCERMIFHIEGNTLQVDVKLSEWEEETVYFVKSRQSLNDLDICDVKEAEN